MNDQDNAIPNPGQITPESDFNINDPALLGDDAAAGQSIISPTPPGLPLPDPVATAAAAVGSEDDDLADIRHQALQALSPLVKYLDQAPAEKFKTTMMLIQASDDKSLIPAAYDAAVAIASEVEKAQALLDLVNEINYFTQKQ
jgi:hypothetical protein